MAWAPAMAKMRKKADLPQKLCAACARPFAWRKKWARDWEAVRYCSDACRAAGASTPKQPAVDPLVVSATDR